MSRSNTLRGRLAAIVLCLLALFFFSALPAGKPSQRMQLATPSAAEQIWLIGNQPIQNLEGTQGLGGGETLSQGEMWSTGAMSQNLQILPGTVSQTNAEVWGTTAATQNYTGSTFQSGENTNFLSGFAPTYQEEEESSWGSMFTGASRWVSNSVTNVHDYFFGRNEDEGCGGCGELGGIRG